MITDEMVDAACVEWWGPESAILDEYPDLRDVMRRCVAAALAAAPAIDGWHWCETEQVPNQPYEAFTWASCSEACPGSHRTLHLGPDPEAES